MLLRIDSNLHENRIDGTPKPPYVRTISMGGILAGSHGSVPPVWWAWQISFAGCGSSGDTGGSWCGAAGVPGAVGDAMNPATAAG